jgi:hypothetical protein
MVKTNIYLIIVVSILVQFSWYYLTLPGSFLSPNKKHPRAPVKSALIGYLTYAIPMFILIYYLSSKDKTCAIANAYVGLICKQ